MNANDTAEWLYAYYKQRDTKDQRIRHVNITYVDLEWTQFDVEFIQIVHVTIEEARRRGGYMPGLLNLRVVHREVPVTYTFRLDRENLANDTLRKKLEAE